jgi:hypothetical protein
MSQERGDSEFDEPPDWYQDEPCCYDCGGRGWKIVCCDDLCHGMDECIHGDPPVPCQTCNPKGEREDALYY